MSKKLKRIPAISVMMVLTLAILACNLTSLARPGSGDQAPVPVSSEAVEQLVDNIEDAAATAIAGGTVTLVITEQQLTSLAVLEMQSSSTDQIQDMQIRLRDGMIRITGQVNESGLSLRAAIDIKVVIDEQGKPHSEVVSARVGPFPLPDSLINELVAELDQFLLNEINKTGKEVFVQQITIADGKMTIVGNLK